MANKITQCLDTKVSLPAIGQGAIGIESRCDNEEINQLLQALSDKKTTICITAERAMNTRLNGGCQVPIAGFAEIKQQQLLMRGLVGNPDGSIMYRVERVGHIKDAAEIGTRVADELLSQGADKVLTALYS